jgi:hypothetical protein
MWRCGRNALIAFVFPQNGTAHRRNGSALAGLILFLPCAALDFYSRKGTELATGHQHLPDFAM